MSNQVRCTLEIESTEAGRDVYFKNDGGRFGSPVTAKFFIQTGYRFRLVVRPASRPLKHVLLNGFAVQFTSNEPFDLDKDLRINFVAKCLSLTPTPRRTRDQQLVIQTVFEDESIIMLELQPKYYKRNNFQQQTWGFPLNQIHFHCSKIEPTDLCYEIVRCAYR